MKNIPTFFLVSLALITVPAVSRAQLAVIGESNERPIPEIKPQPSRAIGTAARKGNEAVFPKWRREQR